MSRIGIFMAEGCEEIEGLTVVDIVRRAGLEIDMISITDKVEVTSSHNVTIKADKLFSEADFSAAEMLILPGGLPGTPNLLAYEPLTAKLKELNKAGKLLAAVCAAPSILGAAHTAASNFPALFNSLSFAVSGSYASRFGVPGSPPGSISISAAEKSASLKSLSAFMVTLCELVTSTLSVIEIMSISSPALLTISTTVRPSISSQPSAINIPILLILFSFFCYNYYI